MVSKKKSLASSYKAHDRALTLKGGVGDPFDAFFSLGYVMTPSKIMNSSTHCIYEFISF